MLELRTDIEIDAPVERVWEVLTDFDRFPDWNPFIRRIPGNAQVGSRLDVFLGASGTRGMRFRPKVTKSARTENSDGLAVWVSLDSSMASTSSRSSPSGQPAPGSSNGSDSAVSSSR